MHKSKDVVQDTFKYSGILRPGKISQKSLVKEGNLSIYLINKALFVLIGHTQAFLKRNKNLICKRLFPFGKRKILN
jgi:hypothetical protein